MDNVKTSNNRRYISIEDFKDWSNRIIFSPNATGKTRVTNALKNEVLFNESICNRRHSG